MTENQTPTPMTPAETLFPTGSASLFPQGKWILPLGVLMIILGVLSLLAAFTATMVSVIFVGMLLLVAAIAQTIDAFQRRGWKGFAFHLVVAALYLVSGAVILASPLTGALMITLALGATMVLAGIFRGISAFTLKNKYWGWAALSGIVSVALGAYILALWPLSSLFILGLLVGVDLLMTGFYMLSFASLPVRATEGRSLQRPLRPSSV